MDLCRFRTRSGHAVKIPLVLAASLRKAGLITRPVAILPYPSEIRDPWIKRQVETVLIDEFWHAPGLSEEERSRAKKAPKTPRNPSKALQGSGVYLLHSPEIGLTKIGCSVRLIRRIEVIWSSVPEDLELIGVIPTASQYSLETLLHNLYAEVREKGEWFRLDGNQILEIMQRYKSVLINRRVSELLSN